MSCLCNNIDHIACVDKWLLHLHFLHTVDRKPEEMGISKMICHGKKS